MHATISMLRAQLLKLKLEYPHNVIKSACDVRTQMYNYTFIYSNMYKSIISQTSTHNISIIVTYVWCEGSTVSTRMKDLCLPEILSSLRHLVQQSPLQADDKALQVSTFQRMPHLLIRIRFKGVKVHSQSAREQDGILICTLVQLQNIQN